MCDSFFVGGRYHTVGTLTITVYPMQTPDPEGDLLCTGVRSTRYGDGTWLANSVLRIVAYYFILLTSSRACRSSRALWSLSGHETYLIEREYRDWHSICGVQSTSAMPLHILGCKHLIYQFAYELDSEDGLKGSLATPWPAPKPYRPISCSGLAVLEFFLFS